MKSSSSALFAAVALPVFTAVAQEDGILFPEPPAVPDRQLYPDVCYKRPYGSAGEPIRHENSERLLLRTGLIDAIPKSLCSDPASKGKNVMLVIGDGMGWEMVRAGAIVRQVLNELEGLGVNTQTGAQTDELARKAKDAFEGRTLEDYYMEGK
jgi:hypothetical protein